MQPINVCAEACKQPRGEVGELKCSISQGWMLTRQAFKDASSQGDACADAGMQTAKGLD